MVIIIGFFGLCHTYYVQNTSSLLQSSRTGGLQYIIFAISIFLNTSISGQWIVRVLSKPVTFFQISTKSLKLNRSIILDSAL